MQGKIQRISGFNLAAVGANTGVLNATYGSALTPLQGSHFILTVALTTGSVLNVTATDGTTTHKWGLEKSTALNAADLYAWEIPVIPTLAYDFEVETDGIWEYLVVEEAYAGAL